MKKSKRRISENQIKKRLLGVVRKQIEKPLSARVGWRKRAKIIRRYVEATFRELDKKGQLSAVHNIQHVNRVAFYAKKYTQMTGGNETMQLQAYVAGLLHDIVRPMGPMGDHAILSAQKMYPILERRLDKLSLERINEAIAKHSTFPERTELGKNLLRDAIFFTDKFFEANGAYIVFRRAMHQGERKDRREEMQRKKLKTGEAAIEFMKRAGEQRISEFAEIEKAPDFLKPFLEYQRKWQDDFMEALGRREAWAVNLTEKFFKEGLKTKRKSLDELILGYKPIGEKDARFKKEALKYLCGDLWGTFTKLTKNR